MRGPLLFSVVAVFQMAEFIPIQTTASRPIVCLATRLSPTTPLEMALRLERQLSAGAGILMPTPDHLVRLDGGIIPQDEYTKGFPSDFLAGLVPEETKGIEVWRVTLRTDDNTGNVIFYNADGEAFWSVTADASVYAADWIARLHSADGTAGNFFNTDGLFRQMRARAAHAKIPEEAIYRSAWLATRQYFRPSHVEMTFSFVLRDDLEAYSAAVSGQMSLSAPTSLADAGADSGTALLSAANPLTGLAITAIAADTNGVALSAAWPATTSLAGGALDLFFSPSLVPPAWTNILRVATNPATNGLDIVVPRTLLPPVPEAAPAACVTNIIPSAYDSGVLITNIVCTNAVRLTSTGFFRLADLADIDSDGLTDAFENWVSGTSSENPDSDGDGMPDGWEVTYGFNPTDASDGTADADGDGLTNAQEYLAWTDPYNNDTIKPVVQITLGTSGGKVWVP